MTLPAVVLGLVVIGYGVVYNVVSSFFTAPGAGGVTRFAGLSNYSRLLHDPVFFRSLEDNGIWFALTIGAQTAIAYGLALALEHWPGLRGLVKAVFFIPVMFGPAVVGLVWARIYFPYGGLLSNLASATHLPLPHDWLGSASLALYSVAIVNVWQWTGFSLLISISAVKNVPPELREAAMLDGARYWRIVRSVIVPCTRPAFAIMFVLGVIGSLQTFGLIFVMTSGGPGNASQVLGTYVFQQAFMNGNYNYGATLGVVLLLITVGITTLQLRLLRRRLA
jgi:multiple sugar transport system permease protein/raffinose/stachyose/melibiose transport system permease protein